MKDRMHIKVCGMRSPENLEQVCSLAPDYVGFIFYAGSKRYVGSSPDPMLFKGVPSEITKVGVFVNEQPATVKELYGKFGLDMVQLHGHESPSYCRDLEDSGIPVIKAMAPESMLVEYRDVVQFFLFDTPGPGWGGTGRKFNWDLLNGRSIPGPFLMSGGIGPEDATVLGKFNHENFRGVDVNSKFEREPGWKDIGLLEEFITELRK